MLGLQNDLLCDSFAFTVISLTFLFSFNCWLMTFKMVEQDLDLCYLELWKD